MMRIRVILDSLKLLSVAPKYRRIGLNGCTYTFADESFRCVNYALAAPNERVKSLHWPNIQRNIKPQNRANLRILPEIYQRLI